MKKSVFILLLLIVQLVTAQKSSHMDGQVNISLENETIDGVYTLTNLPVNTQTLSFKLNEHIKVKTIELDGDRIASSKVPQNCEDCLIYTVIVGCEVVITPQSQLRITTEGKFKKIDDSKDIKKYKGELVYSNGVLRAGENNKWYPEVMKRNSNSAKYLDPFNYTYAITANCDDCENLYIGKGEPKPSGSTFENKQVEGGIILLAGNLDFQKGKYANYINVDAQDIPKLEERFAKTRGFLEDITKVNDPDGKIVYAQVSSPIYGSESVYNTILNTTKNVNPNKIDITIEEDEAYYFLANAFKPEDKLDKMLLQSLAKYVKLKYIEESNPQHYATVSTYVQGQAVDIDKRKSGLNDQPQLQALLITPEQFLDMENELGKEKMAAFIQDVFKNLRSGKKSMQVLVDSMNAIENRTDYLDKMERDFLTQFEMRAVAPEGIEVLTGLE
ncbi:hypothetical protein [Leeuwenhoekiella sp. MAR_2009_132]|uniref:hypothetical protein n=1 Tax=Leeuwenhoekiella sp. MAR_2009_132 TaxID=1392489 RepID=UPI000490C35D|nr:hypothetical protein [Leeuwenhoekiella sp. MAR_2009_132]